MKIYIITGNIINELLFSCNITVILILNKRLKQIIILQYYEELLVIFNIILLMSQGNYDIKSKYSIKYTYIKIVYSINK